MTAVEHAARGTYRATVHGPLPPGVVPAPARPVLARSGGKPAGGGKAATTLLDAPVAPPQTLTSEDCPSVLTPEGRALWGVLVAQRPTDRLLGAFVAMFVEAVLAWQRATAALVTGGDVDGQRPAVHWRLRREAEASLKMAAQMLGWEVPISSVAPAKPAEAQKSRLEMFMAAKGGA
jgi:hypothetical protein